MPTKPSTGSLLANLVDARAVQVLPMWLAMRCRATKCQRWLPSPIYQLGDRILRLRCLGAVIMNMASVTMVHARPRRVKRPTGCLSSATAHGLRQMMPRRGGL